MTDVSQPRQARGKLLPAGILAAALFALLAFAPFASATTDPVSSGNTTLTLQSSFTKYLGTFGIKVLQVKPAKVKGAKLTLPITGGSIDPTTGIGELTHSGGIKIKAGKRTTAIRALVLNTAKKSLTGKIGKKRIKIASVAGVSFTRNGFGINVAAKKVKLTGAAASALNKKLGFAKGKPKPFLGNKRIARATSEPQPTTATLLPGGNASLALSAAALVKLKNIGPEVGGTRPFEVKLSPIAPTAVTALGPPPTVAFPVSGGTLSPTGSAGTVMTVGGLQLTQSLEAAPPPGTKGTTTLKLSNIWVDMATKQASVEVTVENPKTPAANLGNLGRASIADISLVGASIVADPATHTISVTNASATLQAVTAATLNQVFVEPIEGTGKGTFAAGDPLGVFSFTVTTQ